MTSNGSRGGRHLKYQIAELFGRDVKTIGKHITNALREELEGIPVVAKFATVQKEDCDNR